MTKKHNSKESPSVASAKNEWTAPLFGIFTAAAVIAFFNLQLLITSISLWVTPSSAYAAGPVIGLSQDPEYSKKPRIVIPKINVDAPVVYGMASVVEADVQNALKSGVLHFGNTVKPGIKGNAVFVGHSSNSVWEDGDYKFVFALTDRLENGDLIYMFHEGKRFSYTVTGKKIVKGNDVSVLKPTNGPTITLITCYPVGTAFSRLVITASQTDPDPNTALDNKEPGTYSRTQLPGN